MTNKKQSAKFTYDNTIHDVRRNGYGHIVIDNYDINSWPLEIREVAEKALLSAK